MCIIIIVLSNDPKFNPLATEHYIILMVLLDIDHDVSGFLIMEGKINPPYGKLATA